MALACGGSEAVVESYYCVMESHRQDGGQSNDILSLRAKVDWCLPDLAQCDSVAEKAAATDKKRNISRHFVGTSGTPKVITRHGEDKSGLPYLQP